MCIAPNAMAKEDVDYRTFSISADAGTLGLGGTVGIRFSDHFGIRAGFNYFEYDYTGDQEGNEYNLNLHLESIPVGIDYYFSRKGDLHITAGVLLNKNRFGGTTTGDVELDDTTYSGITVTTELKPEEITPFITIGSTIYFGNSKRVGLNIEGGIAYLPGGYDVTMTSNPPPTSGSALETDLENERQELEDAFGEMKVYPIFKIGLTVSF